MSQAAVVVGALLAAFVLFLAVNNKLVNYVAMLTGRSVAS